jgi:tetratricopeptide (TPR) repeat protein
MSLKAELETWAAALKAYDEEDLERSLELFSRIADTSKILTNIGLIFATLGEHETAVAKFIEATRLDQHLAVAFFQCGVSNFLLGRFELALKDFDEALLHLRGNHDIRYEQIGLKFQLYSAEVLFNRGLSNIYLGRLQEGLVDMQDAKKDKMTEEHGVIDDAIRDRGEGYTVFSIPVGVLFRPSENKLKNSKAKDYMGTAKLIAASEDMDAFTTFTGSTRLNQGISPAGAYLDQATVVRSATAPNPRVPDDPNMMTRAKTTIRSAPSNQPEFTSLPAPVSVLRNNTTIQPGKASPNARIGGPDLSPAVVRGLSVRKNSLSNQGTGRRAESQSPRRQPSPFRKEEPAEPTRLTEFYEDYLGSYQEDTSIPPVGGGNPDRVAAWARNNADSNNYPAQRMIPKTAPPSSYTSSGGSVRRKLSRRGTGRMRSRPVISVYEDEEGYVSGEYEDGPFELVKIKVKLHYEEDIRGMTMTPDTSFGEFVEKVETKFGRKLDMKFLDAEDGGKVSLRDESDYELAIETARESSKGKPEGKLEIWCVNA